MPTVQVLLDNFLGAFPFDITQYVRFTDGIAFSRGRPDEFAQAAPGTLSLTLDNTDGRFTLGSATYGLGLNQKIRVKLGGTNFGTYYVQAWPVSWPTGGQEYAVVQVTAVDAMSRLSRFPLRSAVEQDILSSGAEVLYPLSEESAATLAGDTSGNGFPSLAIVGSGAAMSFGSGTGPVDGLTCASFAGGKYLQASGAVFIPAGSAFTIECYFATTMVPVAGPALMVDAFDGAFPVGTGAQFLAVNTSGKLQGTSFGSTLSSAASVNDGLVHHAALTLTAGGTLTLYLDGSNVGSTAGVTLPPFDVTTLSVAPSDIALITTPYVGTIAHVAVNSNSAVGSTVIATRAQAANDYTGELPAARIARVCAYAGIPTTALDTAGGTVLGAANQGGRNALDVINEVAEATLGWVFVNGTGQITTRNGYTLTQATAADATLDALYADSNVYVEADLAFVINEVQGGSTSSENVFTTRNEFSIGTHGLYHQDFTWNVNTDTQAVDRTNWIGQIYAGPTARIPALTLDVLTMGGADTTAALALDVSRFLHLINSPTQTPSGVLDLIVQGIQWNLSSTSFTIDLNCSRHADYAAWLLDDPFWSVLDGTTKIFAA